jgi:uncharacterized membrane protein YgdD (TMEM256/DUF423 family)
LQPTELYRWPIVAGAGFALLAVAIGAFAAHGLKAVLSPYALGLVETAARYQMYHALALVLTGVLSLSPAVSKRWLEIAAVTFCVGIAVFSGSLYALALSGIGGWGAVTPVGGLAFIVGWGSLIAAALASRGRR